MDDLFTPNWNTILLIIGNRSILTDEVLYTIYWLIIMLQTQLID